MKKSIVLASAILSVALVGCGQKKADQCNITLKLNKDVLQKVVGKKVFVSYSKDTTLLDSATITGEELKLKSITPKDSSLNLAQLTIGNMPYTFVVEKGAVSFTLSKEKFSFTGTPLNDAITKYENETDSIIKPAQEKLNELFQSVANDKKGKSEDSVQKQMQAIVDPVNKQLDAIAKRTFEAHKNDAVGFVTLVNLLNSQALSIADKQALIKSAGPLIRQNKEIDRLASALAAVAATSPGKMFKDFTGVDDNNKSVKLSDYVGKGHYTLVDFYASWCGPCRHEIPNIIKAYNDYKRKGLNVVGVAVWDKMGDHLKAVKDLKITYPQIFNEKEATNLYGIQGIPQIILFAPDGTIVARDLRGEAIHQKLADILAKEKSFIKK